MKFRTSIKAIRDEFGKKNIISIGYCEAQSLLSFIDASAYTCGVYGWNFDMYEIHGTAICTGYRGMPAGLEYDYNKLKELELAAEKIRADYKRPYKERKDEVEKLLIKFIDKVKGGSK